MSRARGWRASSSSASGSPVKCSRPGAFDAMPGWYPAASADRRLVLDLHPPELRAVERVEIHAAFDPGHPAALRPLPERPAGTIPPLGRDPRLLRLVVRDPQHPVALLGEPRALGRIQEHEVDAGGGRLLPIEAALPMGDVDAVPVAFAAHERG